MDLIAALNLQPIFQLTFVSLIMIAGPVVIFLLAFRGGDLQTDSTEDVEKQARQSNSAIVGKYLPIGGYFFYYFLAIAIQLETIRLVSNREL